MSRVSTKVMAYYDIRDPTYCTGSPLKGCESQRSLRYHPCGKTRPSFAGQMTSRPKTPGQEERTFFVVVFSRRICLKGSNAVVLKWEL